VKYSERTIEVMIKNTAHFFESNVIYFHLATKNEVLFSHNIHGLS